MMRRFAGFVRFVRFVRDRLGEGSTWVGLALLGTAMGLVWGAAHWRWEHAVLAGLGAALALLSDRRLALIWPLIDAAVDLPPDPVLSTVQPQEESKMGLFQTIESDLASRTAREAARLAAETIAGVTADAPLAGEARKVLTDAQAALAQDGFLPWIRLAAEAAETIHDLSGKLADAEARAAGAGGAAVTQRVAAT